MLNLNENIKNSVIIAPSFQISRHVAICANAINKWKIYYKTAETSDTTFQVENFFNRCRSGWSLVVI